MKPNKLLIARIIISIHARRGRVVKFKSTQYQLVDDMFLKETLIITYGKNVFNPMPSDTKISIRLPL